MFQKAKPIILTVIFTFIMFGCTGSNQNITERNVRAEVFADLGGRAHGLTFDREGNIYAAIFGIKIVKISPEGAKKTFAIIEGIGTPEWGNVSIWDISFGPDNMLYAAARDRILKIFPDGKIATYIKEDFPGPYGAVSIRADSKGNLFVSCGTMVVRYDSSLTKTVIIDAAQEDSVTVENIIGIELDPSETMLYACDTSRRHLLQCTLTPDGSRGELSVLFKEPGYYGEYVTTGSETMILCGPDFTRFYLFGKNGISKFNVEHPDNINPEIQMLKFSPVEKDTIYGTAYKNGKIYKIKYNP